MKKILCFVLSTVLLFAFSATAMAATEHQVLICYGDERPAITTEDFEQKGLLASYNVYADKGRTFVSSNPYIWNYWGWTRLIDKKSGEDVYHYTNLQAKEDRYDPYWLVETGRKWGRGKIWVDKDYSRWLDYIVVWYGTEI